MATEAPERETRETAPVGIDPIIVEARERWQRRNEAEKAQRELTLKAKQFRAGDQWDPRIRAIREGIAGPQGPQPPKPCLTIDRLSQPVRQVSNQIKTANFAINVAASGQGADAATAEIFKGHLRRCQNQARGESPIEWAADGAIEGGIGWFRIRTEFVVEVPEEPSIEIFDQELRLERITNNMTVYAGPASLPTKSDMKYCFVTEDKARDDFKDEYPRASLRSLDEFSGTGNPIAGEWVTTDTIRIAEYWTITYTDEKWAVLPDGSIQKVKDFPKDAVQKRTVRRPKVKGYKINACEILEEWDWLGTRIPLIPILGEELNVDGETILRGIITEGMDAQRMVNYTYSGAMEIFALGSKGTYVAAAGQVDPYKEIWNTRTTINHAWLPYDPMSIAGVAVPPPHIEATEAPIQAAVELMRVSEEAIKATTGYYDSGLGSHDNRVQSGRAKQSEIQQSDLGSSNYPDNVKRALIYAGELMVEILPKITRPGQILHILGLDDEPKQIPAGVPFIPGPKGQPPKVLTPEEVEQQAGQAQFYDLKKGRYAVTANVGKADATKREEGAAALGELIPHLPPEMAAVATPDYVEQLDFPNSHKIAEKLRKALPPQLQDQDEQADIPPQLQAMLAQLQGENQQLKQMVETDQAKQQAQIQKATLDAQSAHDLKAMDIDFQRWKVEHESETKMAVAELGAKVDRLALFLEERARIGAEDAQATQSAFDRTHDVNMAQIGHDQKLAQAAAGVAGDAALADQSHQQALQQGEQAHGQALEQTETEAALQPKPTAE